MRRFCLSMLPLLALGMLGASCGQDDPGLGANTIPIRGAWETIVDDTFLMTNTSLSIGDPGQVVSEGRNFYNRGDIEVYYTLDEERIVIQYRKFTFAESLEAAQDAKNGDFPRLLPWISTAGNNDPVEMLDPEDLCSGAVDPETGETLPFQNGCEIRLYFDGLTQKLRSGADIRVFLPRGWEGTLNVTTTDNLEEKETYPDRSDVTIVGLAGLAFIEVDAGRVNVSLDPGVEIVPDCDADANQQCEDNGWDQTDPALCHCTDFGKVQLRTRGTLPLNATVDAPADLWMTARLENTKPGLAPTSDPNCPVDIACDDFGGCFDHDAPENMPWKRRQEMNIPAASIPGLGYSIDLEAGDCAETEYVEGPDDFEMPRSELRGELRLCTGCLADISVPDAP